MAAPYPSAASDGNENSRPFFYYPAPIDVEDLRTYADGSLFPVHLGDIFKSSSSSYQVLLKIGHGSYSTVWLARDLDHDDRHVALKFLTAGARGDSEVEILQWIREHKDDHPGYQYALKMLDNFKVGDPYPTHNVIVTDVLIPFHQLGWRAREKLLSPKQACSQLMRGLAFLHSQDITHGDLYQGNLAIRIPIDPTGKIEELLDRLGLPELVPVLDNAPRTSNLASGLRKQDRSTHMPKYLVTNSVFEDYVQNAISSDALRSADVELQVIDFSNSYRGLVPSPLPKTFSRVQAPEIFASKLNQAVKCGGVQSDIWSAACTIFEIACPGSILFEWYRKPKAMLEEVAKKIGPLPDSWQLATLDSMQPTSPVSPDQYWEECLIKCISFQQDTDAARACLSLIRRMLQVDPESRPSAELLCSDRWWEDGVGDQVDTGITLQSNDVSATAKDLEQPR